MLYAPLDGTVPCRACGRVARLDIFSRWAISCVIAIILSSVLLYGGFFYSGHLFVVSMFIILGVWRTLSYLGLPAFALEAVDDRLTLDRRHSLIVLAVLLIAAVVFDGFMASLFEPDSGLEDTRATSAVHGDRRDQ